MDFTWVRILGPFSPWLELLNKTAADIQAHKGHRPDPHPWFEPTGMTREQNDAVSLYGEWAFRELTGLEMLTLNRPLSEFSNGDPGEDFRFKDLSVDVKSTHRRKSGQELCLTFTTFERFRAMYAVLAIVELDEERWAQKIVVPKAVVLRGCITKPDFQALNQTRDFRKATNVKSEEEEKQEKQGSKYARGDQLEPLQDILTKLAKRGYNPPPWALCASADPFK